MCLAVDHSSDQCLFISKSDPLKGMCGSPSLPCCLCHDEALLPVGAGGDNFPSTPLLLQLFSQGAFGYVLPIISFILAWIETWFLDFKVLPQEAEEENSKFLFLFFTFSLPGLHIPHCRELMWLLTMREASETKVRQLGTCPQWLCHN